MGTAVLVPIGPGPNDRPRVVGRPWAVDDGKVGNDVAAEAVESGVTHLVVFPTDHGGDRSGHGIDRWPADANFGEQAIAEVERLGDRVGLACGPGRTVTLSVAAVIAAGGFDPDQPGLGLLDLVDRLEDTDWSVVGIGRGALPFVPALTAELGTAERVMSEGRWLANHAAGRSGRRRLDRYHRLVLDTIAELRADAGSDPTEIALLDRLEAEAGRRWRGLRPDQAQQGVGRRADWRHLLPPRPTGARPRSLAVLTDLGTANEWHWLVEDGWVERVETAVPTTPSADVIVLGPAPVAELVGRIEAAAKALATDGALCLLVSGGRSSVSAGGHRRLLRSLRRNGLAATRRHLALPDARAAKRYVPLDHPGGLAWLAGPEPALEVAALPSRRRHQRDLAGRLGGQAPELIGDLAVVATAAQRPDWPQAVVLTSGFDEGSRTVLLPFDGPTATRPSAVVKVTARPAYRSNGTREHRLLSVLAPRVEPPGLVPEPREPIEVDGLPAVVESYAGRWTATDILNEQASLQERSAVLRALFGAVTDLNRTGLGTERWSDKAFESHLGRWFDEVDRIDGPSAARAALRADLAERSARFVGVDLPVGLRHFDLGPWNLVLADGSPDEDGSNRSLVTAVDWELAPPREMAFGFIGADHLYLSKYWLHIAMGCASIDEEQAAFAFLGEPTEVDAEPAEEARAVARAALVAVAAKIGLPTGFLPLLEVSVWAEATCYTSRRRHRGGGDGGSPLRYLDTLARRRVELLSAWPLADQ
ncbi:MAG: hypothetical protein AAFO29_07820 [Actinomycetota bacterium]